MSRCELCGNENGSTLFEGLCVCGNCYNQIYMMRNNNEEYMDFYAKKENLVETSDRAKEVIRELFRAKPEWVIQKLFRTNNLSGYDETILPDILGKYKEQKEKEFKNQQEEYKKVINQRRNDVLENKVVICTTGNILEGYRIIDYIDILCSEELLLDDIAGLIRNNTFFTSSALREARKQALDKIKIMATDVGANAVIGIDIDIVNVGKGPTDAIIVSVNGTAVRIEPI